MKSKPGFLSSQEKADYYATISGFCKEHFIADYSVNVYEGGSILFYHYDGDGNLRFDTTLLCAHLSADSNGLKAVIVDRQTYEIYKLGDVPNLVSDGVVCHMPYRAVLERTVKLTQRKKIVQGLATTVRVHSESFPDEKTPHHVQAISMNNMRKFFTEEEINQAEKAVTEVR